VGEVYTGPGLQEYKEFADSPCRQFA
jgi:hypothetical protein